MPEPRHWHFVMYDVRDPRRLRRTHKTLSSWGVPLQLSVFRVRGTAREMERLRFELAKILADDDRLLIARLCPGCASRVATRGPHLSDLSISLPAARIV